jgi:hypothetical protein
VESLAELQERRARELRVDSIDDAEALLRDRGILTRTDDSALPSFAAPTFGGLAGRPGVHELHVHTGKPVLFSDEVLALADATCRGELARMEAADEGWARMLRQLGDAGASTPEDLRRALGLKRPEVRALLSPLLRCGAVVRRGDAYLRYDTAYPEPAAAHPVEDLIVAAVSAAVVAREREATRWFSWRWLLPTDLVERLVVEGRLRRPAPGWIAAPASASARSARGTGGRA